MNAKNEMMIPEEVIMSKIYLIRGIKVMLDMDLAELYGVENKQLKRAVRRNLSRFPSDFMFRLSTEEWENVRSQIVTASMQSQNVTASKRNFRFCPCAFAEQGVDSPVFCESLFRVCLNINDCLKMST